MNFRTTLGLTAAAAFAVWPQLASAQMMETHEADGAEVEIQIEEEALEAEEEEAVRAEEPARDGADIIIEQPAPEIIVEQPAPDIEVRQPEPQVRVQQQRPEVEVERVGEPEVRFRGEGETDVELRQIERAAPAEEEDLDVEVEVQEMEAEEPLFEEPAEAEEPLGMEMEQLAPEGELIQDAILTPFGTSLMVGGGVSNFTQSEVTDNTDIGGYWDVRGALGTRSIIGVEAAYRGSAHDIEAIGLRDETFLVGNGLEAAARLNAPLTFEQQNLNFLIEPFAFGGLGWTRYNLFNEGVNTSDILDQDDVLVVPVGVGIAGAAQGLLLDARFTYRPTFGNDLVGDATNAFDSESLTSWTLGANIGFEF